MTVIEYGKQNTEIIILLHGGGLSWWNYREVAKSLEMDYHVILPVLDGHAGSDAPFATIEDNAARLISYIDTHFGGQVAVLGGLSLGGQIALEMLARRPDICRFALIESAQVKPSQLTCALIGPTFGVSYDLIKQRWFAKLQAAYLGIPKELFEDYYRDTCNFRCKFCPSGNLELMKKTKGRGHGPMDFEVYKSIIDSLQEFPDPIRVIRLYKEGEPLVNPRFADMVSYAKQSPKVLRVDTTTNASLLTPERSLEIIDAGLDRLNISVEGVNADQYRDFSGHKMDYQKFVDNIAFFYDHKGKCEMNIKINGDILTPEQEEAFYRTFGNITDGINVERTIEYWPKFNDMKVDFDEEVSLLGGKSREVQVCPYVFYEMCINSNGTYSLCRFDWNHAMILDQHVSDPPTPKKIWDSIVLWRFQEQFLKKERKMMTVLSCPKCGILKQGVPEDLDEFAEEILDEM